MPREKTSNVKHVIYRKKLGGINQTNKSNKLKNAAHALSWCGEMNPYPYGSLVAVGNGPCADMIVINRDQIADIAKLKRGDIKGVVNNGVCFKYTLEDQLWTHTRMIPVSNN